MLFDYFSLTTIIGALVTTTIVVVVLKRFANTTQESWSVTPNEGEQAVMLDNVEPSILILSTDSTPAPATNTALTIPSSDKGLMRGDELEGLDRASLSDSGTPHWRELKDWNHLHLDQSSMEYPTGIGTKFSLKDEPDTDSSVLSTFTFESRPITPPRPQKGDSTKASTKENSILKPERKQRKASPSRIQTTLPPAKRHKKHDQGSLLPQLFPTTVSTTKLFYKRRSTGLPTLKQHGRIRSPKPPLHNMATIHTTSPSLASTTRKAQRQCIMNLNSKLPLVPYQPPTSSEPITMFGPYPLHKPCPLAPHEQPSPLPPYDQHIITRPRNKYSDSVEHHWPLGLSSDKIQHRDVHLDRSNHKIVGYIQNQQNSHPYLKSKLLYKKKSPIFGQEKFASAFPSIDAEQKGCPTNVVDSASTSVGFSIDQRTKCKYMIDGAVSPQDNLTSHLVSIPTKQYNLVKKDYVSDSHLDLPMLAATGAQTRHDEIWDDNNAQIDNIVATTTSLPSVGSTPTTLTEDNHVGNSEETHPRAKQALNIFVQESDCTCSDAPTFHIAGDKLIPNDNFNIVKQNDLHQEIVADENESGFWQVTSDDSKTASLEPIVESSNEYFGRENTNSWATTSRCTDQTLKDVECNKTWNKLQQKAFNEQVPSLQLLRNAPISPGPIFQAKYSRLGWKNLCTCPEGKKFEREDTSLRRKLTFEKIRLRKRQEFEERMSCKYEEPCRVEKLDGLLCLALTKCFPLSQYKDFPTQKRWKVVPPLCEEIRANYGLNATRSQGVKISCVEMEYEPLRIGQSCARKDTIISDHLRIQPLQLSSCNSIKSRDSEEDEVLKKRIFIDLNDEKPFAKFTYLDDTVEFRIYPELTYGDDHIKFVNKPPDLLPIIKQLIGLSQQVQVPQKEPDDDVHPLLGDIIISLSPTISPNGEETFVYFFSGNNFVDPRMEVLNGDDYSRALLLRFGEFDQSGHWQPHLYVRLYYTTFNHTGAEVWKFMTKKYVPKFPFLHQSKRLPSLAQSIDPHFKPRRGDLVLRIQTSPIKSETPTMFPCPNSNIDLAIDEVEEWDSTMFWWRKDIATIYHDMIVRVYVGPAPKRKLCHSPNFLGRVEVYTKTNNKSWLFMGRDQLVLSSHGFQAQ